MATHPVTIDISNNPDLVRLVEEVKNAKQPRILEENNRPVVFLTLWMGIILDNENGTRLASFDETVITKTAPPLYSHLSKPRESLVLLPKQAPACCMADVVY